LAALAFAFATGLLSAAPPQAVIIVPAIVKSEIVNSLFIGLLLIGNLRALLALAWESVPRTCKKYCYSEIHWLKMRFAEYRIFSSKRQYILFRESQKK